MRRSVSPSVPSSRFSYSGVLFGSPGGSVGGSSSAGGSASSMITGGGSNAADDGSVFSTTDDGSVRSSDLSSLSGADRDLLRYGGPGAGRLGGGVMGGGGGMIMAMSGDAAQEGIVLAGVLDDLRASLCLELLSFVEAVSAAPSALLAGREAVHRLASDISAIGTFLPDPVLVAAGAAIEAEAERTTGNDLNDVVRPMILTTLANLCTHLNSGAGGSFFFFFFFFFFFPFAVIVLALFLFFFFTLFARIPFFVCRAGFAAGNDRRHAPACSSGWASRRSAPRPA